MERFIQFRNECIKNTNFHPLLTACRILSAFLHVHPFIDGNGRVGISYS
jgi:Fic family protein